MTCDLLVTWGICCVCVCVCVCVSVCVCIYVCKDSLIKSYGVKSQYSNEYSVAASCT